MDHIKHEHSRSAVGLTVIRCSLCFVFVIVLVPFYTTFMVLRQNDSPSVSIWWLRPVDEEDLVLIEEEREQNMATQLKLRKWAKKQKELASALVSAGKFRPLLSCLPSNFYAFPYAVVILSRMLLSLHFLTCISLGLIVGLCLVDQGCPRARFVSLVCLLNTCDQTACIT